MRRRHNPARYYYWIATAFFQKNLRFILVSFLITIVLAVSMVTLLPYIVNSFLIQREVIGMVGQPTYDAIPSDITGLVSNSLVGINQDGTMVSILAERWEVNKTSDEFRFFLKKNLVWSDGTAFTADTLHYRFTDVAMKVVDPYTVVFTLKKPFPLFPSYLTQPILRTPLIGVAGLYKTDKIQTKFGIITEISLAPNKPNLPQLTYRFYEDESKMITAYKLGEISEMTLSRKSQADTFKNWNNTIIIRKVDYSKLLTLFFNNANPLLKERDVRQAIAASIPKAELSGLGEEATGPIPPISWAYNPNLHKIAYNPDASDTILKKLGNGASTEVTLSLSTYIEYADIATKIQDYLSAVSLKTKLNIQSFDTLGSFDMLVAYWNVPSDPDQYFFWHSTQIGNNGGNITRLDNKKIDKLLEDGRSNTNIDTRKQIYADFQKTMQDEIPAVFLYYPYIYTVRRK